MSIPKLTHDDITTQDLSQTTYAKLKQILPEVFTEGQDGIPNIDTAKLKIALGGNVDTEEDNTTRYSFNWSGKKQAQRLANLPSTATLCPVVADSKNWDTTQNVYIEGDNLEVLKLLQKSYYGQIKMIYIDPPYNTGKDFVYKDNFTDNVTNYLQKTGQIDDEGNKIDTNTDKNGRYHTDWLNMMYYPRLKLARNLLRDDGVIFISIDDNEVHNLRKICDEIFGEDNFVGEIIWVNRTTPNDAKINFAINHESILIYSRCIGTVNFLGIPKDFSQYKNPDNDPNGVWIKDNPSAASGGESMLFDIVNPNTNQIYSPPAGRYWAFAKNRVEEWTNSGKLVFPTESNKTFVLKKYKNELKSDFIPLGSIVQDIYTASGTKELKNIFEHGSPFNFPKPTDLLKLFINQITKNNDLILDFFSGSATTAHAVMQLNAEDGGNRKYICVQLPEPTPPESEAYKAGYNTICEIGKERIRRAGDKILTQWQETHSKNDLLTEDSQPTQPDIGFRVFKLNTSNFKPIDTSDMLADTMQVLDNRTTLDVFYELTLKQGYSLDYPQTVLDIGGTKCYALLNPADNTPFVLAVLDDTVKINFALELLKHHLNIVFIKDNCFTTDEAKLNTIATLEQLQNKDTALQIRLV